MDPCKAAALSEMGTQSILSWRRWRAESTSVTVSAAMSLAEEPLTIDQPSTQERSYGIAKH